MSCVDPEPEIPQTGAIFTFGKSKFADNAPSKFWIKNDKVIDLDCGDEHTAVITESGRIFAFGSNEWGQLGLGHRKNVNKPSCIKSLKPDKGLIVACGKVHSVVYMASGKLYAFGSNSDGQLGIGRRDIEFSESPIHLESSFIDEEILQLSAGSLHTAALTRNSNRMFVWGANTEGQLGLGSDSEEAIIIPTILDFNPGSSICKISCGYYHTAVITVEGVLYTFGEAEGGRLGLGNIEEREIDIPTKVSIDEKIVNVSCGGSHTMVLSESGKLFSFGVSTNGQLGLGTSVLEMNSPSLITSLWERNINIMEISCGENHSALVTDKGLLMTFGDGRHGKLCLDAETLSNQFNPVFPTRFQGLKIIRAHCGGCHTMIFALPLPPDKEQETEDQSLTNGVVVEDINIIARQKHREELKKTLPPIKVSRKVLPSLEEDPEAIETVSSETPLAINGHSETNKVEKIVVVEELIEVTKEEESELHQVPEKSQESENDEDEEDEEEEEEEEDDEDEEDEEEEEEEEEEDIEEDDIVIDTKYKEKKEICSDDEDNDNKERNDSAQSTSRISLFFKSLGSNKKNKSNNQQKEDNTINGKENTKSKDNKKQKKRVTFFSGSRILNDKEKEEPVIVEENLSTDEDSDNQSEVVEEIIEKQTKNKDTKSSPPSSQSSTSSTKAKSRTCTLI